MEIVLVPTWNRPEFLAATLTRLLLADDGRVRFRILIDRAIYDNAKRLTARVVAEFIARLGPSRVKAVSRENHRWAGNSYNVLTGYQEALAEGADLIHLVEDDVFVGLDYFDFHRRAHDLCPEAFAVSACRNQQYPIDVNPPPDEGAVYLHGSYQSIGVSFKPDRLREVVTHAHPGYYNDTIGYCRKTFPHSQIFPAHAEQDGLIHRIIEDTASRVVYPAVPRAYHAGFYGRNRHGDRVFHVGTLEERSARLLSMTADELNAAAQSYPDHTTVDLDTFRAPVGRLIEWPVGG